MQTTDKKYGTTNSRSKVARAMQSDLQQIETDLDRIQRRRSNAARFHGNRFQLRKLELELDAQADALKGKRDKLLHLRAQYGLE